ncbi:MAG: FecR family protein [Methylococcaceae bacterium]|nr:FecR family protein [Methylococcaceae bacterium]MDP3903231.1 FecR family protein [Methylococcaceae bacterium]
MSQDPNPIDIDSISDQATAWFTRLQADDVSTDERDQFQQWYRTDPQHAEAYEQTRKLWNLLQLPAAQIQSRIISEEAPLTQRPSEPSYPVTTAWRACPASSGMQEVGESKELLPRGLGEGGLKSHFRFAAISALTVLLAVTVWQLPEHLQNWQSDYHTAPGQQVIINLKDGSRLTLSTDTALTVQFSEQQRRIELLRGEAYFEVAPNKSRPFIVDGGPADARAVGTAFSVKKKKDDVRVAVSEGIVEVSADSTSTRVHAAQQIDYQHGQMQAVFNVNNDDTFAWRRGQVVFSRQPLSEVLEEVNRYRSGRIVAVNSALAGRIVSGVFNSRDANSVVDALKATLHAEAVNVPGGLVLLY